MFPLIAVSDLIARVWLITLYALYTGPSRKEYVSIN